MLLLAAVLGCATREVDVQPFRITVTVDDGTPLTASPVDPFAGVPRVSGPATKVDATTLTIEDEARGTVTITFDARSVRGLQFPDRLNGQIATAWMFLDPEHTDPDGRPLPIPGLRIHLGTGLGTRYQFLLGEGTYETPSKLPFIPPPLFPLSPEDFEQVDFPALSVFPDNIYFEPADCGLVYYDQLRVAGERLEDVRFDERVTVPRGETPWQVQHVVSWHRVGDCPDDARTWTQVALWRE